MRQTNTCLACGCRDAAVAVLAAGGVISIKGVGTEAPVFFSISRMILDYTMNN